MQTIQIQLEDNIYKDMQKSGIDIQGELKKMIEKIIYHKEHTIANNIIQGLEEVKLYQQGTINLQNADDLLSELKSAN